MTFANENIFFTTLTVNKWVNVFTDVPESVFIITDTWTYFTKKKNIKIYGFVIMSDHLHFLWSCDNEDSADELISNFKKYTGKSIIKLIKEVSIDYLDNFMTVRKDRDHKFWKIRGGHLKILSDEIFFQKLEYIHLNPTKGEYKTCEDAIQYPWSSAKAYLYESSNFSFLTLYDHE